MILIYILSVLSTVEECTGVKTNTSRFDYQHIIEESSSEDVHKEILVTVEINHYDKKERDMKIKTQKTSLLNSPQIDSVLPVESINNTNTPQLNDKSGRLVDDELEEIVSEEKFDKEDEVITSENSLIKQRFEFKKDHETRPRRNEKNLCLEAIGYCIRCCCSILRP
jgi:hypothetical protein